MNDYTTQGSFRCEMNVTAATLTNCPTNKSFHLEVYAHAGVRQVLYCYFDTEVWTYERNFTGTGSNGSRWSEWHKVPTDDDIASLNNNKANKTHNNKANKTHTHNDFSGPTNVSCSYGTVSKFKKNGWAFVVYENINLASLTMETWTDIADVGWSNQAGNSYTANFQTSILDDRFRITADGKLSAMKFGDSNHQGHYGYIIYPTAD